MPTNMLSKAFQDELRALRDAGAPIAGILGEVAAILGEEARTLVRTGRAMAGFAGRDSAPGFPGRTLSAETKDAIRGLGLDPGRVAAMSDDTDYAEWRRIKAARGGAA